MINNELADIIINEVSDFRKISKEQMCSISNGKKRESTQPRQEAMKLMHDFKIGSLAEIGSKFEGNASGQKDHATVLHSVKVIQNLIDTESVFNETHAVLKNKIENILNKKLPLIIEEKNIIESLIDLMIAEFKSNPENLSLDIITHIKILLEIRKELDNYIIE